MQFINLAAQYQHIKDDVRQRIQAVLEHGQYIMGKEVKELEQHLAEYAGSKHCIGVSSGTDALSVALMALNIGPGDEVITTPFSFIATGETIALVGAKPVFIDINPDTYNMNTALIEAAITDNTKAIMPVSMFGQCADFDEINAVAKKHNLPVIEDGAQSFGATYKGRHSGNLTTIGCTSFFPSKPLGCYGDAGACFTDNDELAVQMRQILSHGQDRRYNHPRIGINGRLDTIQAAILLAKLDIFSGEVEARQRVGGFYTELLTNHLKTPCIKSDNTSVYAQYTVEVDERDRVQAALKEQEIPTAVHYPVPIHLQPGYAYLGYQEGSMPVAETVANKVMSLPMDPYLESSMIERISGALISALNNN